MSVRVTFLALVLSVAACARSAPPEASAAAAPQTSAGPVSCLDHPNYDTMPLPPSGRRGRVAQWLARPDGNGCHWTRNPA